MSCLCPIAAWHRPRKRNLQKRASSMANSVRQPTGATATVDQNPTALAYVMCLLSLRPCATSIRRFPNKRSIYYPISAEDIVTNANTVAKAYRELEYRKVIELRQGAGAFVPVNSLAAGQAEPIRQAQRLLATAVGACESSVSQREQWAGLSKRNGQRSSMYMQGSQTGGE